MKYTPNLNLKKPDVTDYVLIDDLNENADIIDQKLKELEDGVYNAPPNSVNDAAIGSRTPDQSQAPASPGTGTLTQLISWLANRIKAITGKTNWWEAPPTTLQAAKTHTDATSGIHGATSSATANRLIIRDSNGRAKVAAPSASDDIARKAEVDAVSSALNTHTGATSSVHGATSSATANRLIIRDSAGRAKVAAPSASDDIARKAEVDTHAAVQASLSQLGHVNHAVLTTTLNTTWQGSNAPYTKTQTVNGLLATDTPIVDVVMSGTFATDEARLEAWGYVYRITTANNAITLYATEKPTVSLPIQLKVVR